MRCVEIARPGGPEVLVAADRPRPVPGPGQVLIAVRAAGINRPDVFQRQGLYPPPPGASDLPGLEVAGTIVETGEAVMALVAGGGYAEFAIADRRHCLPIPAGLSMVEAAACPEAMFTVWHNVFERGRLAPGETLLVHGGASGIGTTAIQMAKALGARVIATAGGPDKVAACLGLGADRAIDHRAEDFVAAAKEEAKGGVDVILDMVGGGYVGRNLKALAPEGRLVSIAFLAGSKVEIDLMAVMVKRLTLTGSTLRPQSDETKARIAEGLLAQVWPHLETGRIRPHIHTTFPLEQAALAHRLMESNTHVGKIVLAV